MTSNGGYWNQLSVPAAGNLNATRSEASLFLYFAIDDAGLHHLLIQLPNPAPREELFQTRGLVAKVDELIPRNAPPGHWIDVACTDSDYLIAFDSVCDEICASLTTELDTNSERIQSVLATLKRWRRFWAPQAQILSSSAELGLFGELWFLYTWLASPKGIKWWRGPLGDRHDFVCPDLSVEVKTTARPSDGPSTHLITHIDQLDDPVKGDLFVFSLSVSEDTLGVNSLPSVVGHLNDLYAGSLFEETWNERLERAGWNPLHSHQYTRTFRVLREELYRVDDRFPRIVSSSFVEGRPPVGVDDISYSTNLNVVADTHLVAYLPSTAILDPLRRD